MGNIDYTIFVMSTSCFRCDKGEHENCLEKIGRLNGTYTGSKFHCYCLGSRPEIHSVTIEIKKIEKINIITVSKNG